MSRTHADPSRLARAVVAVDGPSGSGKSSVSRAVASSLGLRYLDTGAMYRAFTWWVTAQGIDIHDPQALAAVADQPELVPGTDPGAESITIDGTDVSGPIRSDEVTAAVSAVSAVPAVRARMATLQRALIGAGGIVVEGRDIGTVVAPDAVVKVFLTASEQARALRRTAEHSAADQVEATEVDATRTAMQRRDRLDSSRPTSPLRQAADAVEIDATHLTLDQVVELVTRLVLDRVAGDGTPSTTAATRTTSANSGMDKVNQ
jgi:cytidylate kinase